MIGRKYLKYAIITLINDPTADAVPTTAKYFCKTSNSVYRAMRNAIEKTWVYSKIEDLALYYTATIRTEKGAPTMTEFIFYYVNKKKKLCKLPNYFQLQFICHFL